MQSNKNPNLFSTASEIIAWQQGFHRADEMYKEYRTYLFCVAFLIGFAVGVWLS